ncbi:Zinc finger protein [Nymphaea thermarum]|nr:Zinc finger protein [Nymphaea thermarum]
MAIPRYVNGVAGKYDLWSSFFRSLGFRRLFSTDPSSLRDGGGNAISFSLEGLSPRLRGVFEELDSGQYPENEKTMTYGGDLPEVEAGQKGPGPSKNGSLELEIAHSMPEWIAFIDVLIEADYLSGRRGNGTLLFEGRPASKARNKGQDEETILSRGFASFASDRMDLMRHLSRRDIQLLVATGCPGLNPKMITSSKRLRAYVHIDEGQVCSACHLRGSCTMAYVTPCKKETARMIDVLRLLYVFGYASQTHPSDGHSQRENTKGSVRRLLKQLVELSKLPFDQDYKNSIAMTENFGWHDLEMKKGDWMCPKCEFMNFAKNKRCLRCGVPPPRKQLKPGEWECPGTCRSRNKVGWM